MWREVVELLERQLALESAPEHGPALVVVAWAALVEAWVEVLVAAIVERAVERALGSSQGSAQAWVLLQSRRKPSSSRREAAEAAVPQG